VKPGDPGNYPSKPSAAGNYAVTVLSDHELLQRFIASKDEGAFEVLVRRHGPAVLAVCRRMLGDVHHADDAFQAVFVVLMRKAAAVDSAKPLGHWLHGVAVMVARKARTTTWKRRQRERRRGSEAQISDGGTMEEAIHRDEVHPALDEELCRLPAKYSAPMTLCYLEGKTNEQAAHELGWPKSTLETRLGKARDLLRSRLLKRGIASASASLALLAHQPLAQAVVPEALVRSTLQVASPAGVLLTTQIDTLSKGAMKIMLYGKIKFAAAIAATLCLSTGFAALLATQAFGAEAKPAKEKEPKREGPFAKLPDPSPAFLAKLAALDDDSWLDLGSPAPDPKYGQGFGRSWSPMMAYAPDLRGAFLFGQMNHGMHDEASRRFGDDLWFYHAPSNSWVCAYPGTNVDKPNIKINADGFESDATTGDVVPVGSMVHGYCTITYDSDTKQFVHMPQAEKMYQGLLAPHIAAYRSKATVGAPANASPWYYDTKTGKWNRRKSDGAAPPVRQSIVDLLFYLPHKKSVFFHQFGSGAGQMWLYSFETNKWTALPDPPFNQPTAASDNVAYYDSKRKSIEYLIGGGVHWSFNSETMTWRDAKSGGPGGIGYVCTWTYDAANDVGILMNYRHPDKAANGIWIYDPQKNSWSRSPKTSPAFGDNCSAYYDPELNIHFVHHGRDNSVGGMMAYRYKKANGKAKSK
jgi:RNA polymerase sigma factor (sigma-70 family)